MTYKSFFRFSLTSPPNTYISPSFPAVELAACPNRGNGFTLRNFRIAHAPPLPEAAPGVPDRWTVMVEGESGGEPGDGRCAFTEATRLVVE